MNFSFKNVGHYFAVTAKWAVKALEFAYKNQAAAQGLNQIATAAEQAAGVPSSITDVQTAAFGAYGHVCKVVDSGKERNADGSLDLGTIESDVVDAVIASKKTVDAFNAATGVPKPTK